MSHHSKNNSDIQLESKLNIDISKKVRKLNLEKQLMNIRKSYNPNYVKLNSNACEATETNHKNNLQPSAKDNQINQIETNSEKSSNESNPSKKLNQSIKGDTRPKESCLVIGDSMLEGLERKMSNKRVVKVRNFLGATTDDMYHYLMLLLQKQPNNVILHVGTNDASSCNSLKTLNNILKLRSLIFQS